MHPYKIILNQLIISQQIGVPNKLQQKKKKGHIYICGLDKWESFVFLLPHSLPIPLDTLGIGDEVMARHHSLPALS